MDADALLGTHQCDLFRLKFTGKERDAETGLDYFGARYLSSSQGRFTSADEFTGGPVEVFGGSPTPLGPLPYADITNPQSLNKYAYGYNNPLRYVDPDGHEPSDLEDEVFVAAVSAGTGILGSYIGATIGGAGGGTAGLAVAGVGAIPGAAGGAIAGAAAGGAAGAGVGYALGKGIVFFSKILQGDQSGNRNDQTSNDRPCEASQENVDKVKQGKAPTGKDGKPVELHHQGQNPKGPMREMTRTEHRGSGNYKQNHPRGISKPSRIDRNEAARQRREHWKRKAEELERERQ